MAAPESVKPILQELRREVQDIYGRAFRQMILYGSFARDDAEQGSDVDVLLVLSDIPDPLAELERLSEVIWRLALRYGVVLSVVPVDESEFASRETPLFLNVRREGVLV